MANLDPVLVGATPVTLPAGLTYAASQSHTISLPNGIKKGHRLLLHIAATTAGDITFLEGVNPPSFRPLGNFVLSTAANTTYFVVLESARFINASGQIAFSTGTGAAGTIRAYVLEEVC
jgi:hypothetical protein